jgi:hypothetical protein
MDKFPWMGIYRIRDMEACMVKYFKKNKVMHKTKGSCRSKNLVYI